MTGCDYEVGFLGLGAMGGALAKAVVAAADSSTVTGFDVSPDKLKTAAQAGLTPLSSVGDLARCATVFLAVKPQVWRLALSDLAPELGDEHLVVSIMAGVPTSALSELMPRSRLVRIMPNNPALLGEGAIAVSQGPRASADDIALVKALLARAGLVVEVPEKLMDAVTGLSGSGPAYFYLLIEALAEGGVLCGLDRATSLQLTAQTALGAAKMVLESKTEPAALKGQVTSPGGTTAEALRVLEINGVRGALIEAVRAATERSKQLGS